MHAGINQIRATPAEDFSNPQPVAYLETGSAARALQPLKAGVGSLSLRA